MGYASWTDFFSEGESASNVLPTELLLSEGIPDLIVGLDEFVLDIDVLLVTGLDLILDRDSITRGDDGTLTPALRSHDAQAQGGRACSRGS